jgi:acyl carrier protein
MNTQEKVIDLIAKNMFIDKADIHLNTSLMDDLEADSLDIVELTMTLEEEFNIDFVDADIANFKTISDLVNYIDSKEVSKINSAA